MGIGFGPRPLEKYAGSQCTSPKLKTYMFVSPCTKRSLSLRRTKEISGAMSKSA